MYQEENYLMISGLEHFAFCRRQWALIHIEQQWAENSRTVDGAILHEKAHNSDLKEKRGDLIITRGVKVFSANLGISGECDVLEFRKSEKGISLHGYDGLWQPYPVEYKRGTPAAGDGNALQLCAQAMCLEEMLCCDITEGALFYGEIRRRDMVQFTEELRQRVKDYLKEMHDYYKKGYTPKVKTGKGCNACSLKEVCVPKLTKTRTVKTYLQKKMEEDV